MDIMIIVCLSIDDTIFVLFCRGALLGGTVDVLCYRDYTREGKRINTHSLLIQGVQLPAKAEGEPSVFIMHHGPTYLHTSCRVFYM